MGHNGFLKYAQRIKTPNNQEKATTQTVKVNKSYASGQKPNLRQELYIDDENLNPALSAQKRRDSLFGN